VILAILAAIAIPALTGYIRKAGDSEIEAEGRTVAIALQAMASEMYYLDLSAVHPSTHDLSKACGEGVGVNDPNDKAEPSDWIAAINALTGTNYQESDFLSMSFAPGNKIYELKFGSDHNGKTAFYSEGVWSINDSEVGVSAYPGGLTLPYIEPEP
jgi:type II secretory pathway pseudopilin PulG